MDILMPETCWAHKNWNKIASDIKLIFHSSNIGLVFAEENNEEMKWEFAVSEQKFELDALTIIG